MPRDYFRLRHLCLATDDLARAKRDLPAIFGVELAHVDPLAADFQVENAIFPFGEAIVEVMAPMGPGAPSARFLHATGGRGGYMLGFNCSDPQRRAMHANALGVRTAAEAPYPGFVCWQMHPRDCRAAMIEFDRTDGGEPLDGPLYAAGGTGWREHIRTGVTRRIVDVVLESPEPHALAAHWSRVLERPWTADGDDAARIDVALIPIRVRRVAPGVREAFAAITVAVADPAPVLDEARRRGYPVEGRAVRMCGVAFELQTEGDGR